MRSLPSLLPGGIRARLFLLIALVLLPMLGLQGWIYHQSLEVRRQQALQTEMEVAQGLATTFAAFVLDVRRLTFTTGRAIITFERYTREKARRLLQDAADQHPALRNASWVATDGTLLASTEPKLVGADFSGRPYFRQVVDGAPWAIGPLTATGIISPAPTFAIATAIHDDSGALRGVLVAGIEPELLVEELFLPLRRPAGGRFAIFDGQGLVVFRGPGLTLTWDERQQWLAGDSLLRHTLQTGEAVAGIVDLAVPGGRWLAARAPIAEFSWVAGAGRPLEMALAPIRAQLRQDVALAAVIAAAAFVLAWFVARTIAAPLQALDADARALGEGGAAPRDEPAAPAEIHRLRATVTAMAEGLLARADAVRESEERFRNIADHSPMMIWVTEANGQAVYLNKVWYDFTGQQREEALGLGWLAAVHPEDTERAAEIFLAANARYAPFSLDYRLRRGDGEYRWCIDSAAPRFGAHGEFLGYIGSVLDIADRKMAEEALRQSEAKFRAVFEQAAIGIGRASFTDARWIDVNEAFCRMLGYSAEELRATPWPEITHPEDVDLDIIPFRRMAAGELENYSVEKRFIHQEGRHVWARLTLSLMRDAQGRPDYEIAIIEDISERKRAEEELRRSEARWNAAIESFAEGVIIATEDEQVIYWNPAARAMHGFSRPDEFIEPLEKTPITFQLWTPDGSHMLDLHEWPMRRIKRGETVRNLELRIHRPDQGWEKFFSYSGTMVDTTGGERLIFLTCRDMTELRRAEEELRRSEERFRVAQELSPDGFVIFRPIRDAQGRIVDFTWVYENAANARMSGTDPQAVVGRSLLEVFPDHGSTPFHRVYAQVAESGEPQVVEADYQGESAIGGKWFRVAVVPIGFDIAALVQDVTASKQAEEYLRNLKEELEVRVQLRTAELSAANQELEAFAYTVSHDLRAPLRHVSGFTELLEKDIGPQLDEQGQRYIRIIADASRRMGALIDDLLLFSRLGRTAVSTSTVSLAKLVDEARAELAPEMAGRRIDWRIGELPQVQGDTTLLRTVMVNLLGNALKYTRGREPAVIEIGATQQEGEVIVWVRDNGAGFDMRFADKLFGVFQRLHPESRFEGTGIGLASVRRIIERHGGRVWAEGEVDRGATLYFSLPNGTAADS